MVTKAEENRRRKRIHYSLLEQTSMRNIFSREGVSGNNLSVYPKEIKFSREGKNGKVFID